MNISIPSSLYHLLPLHTRCLSSGLSSFSKTPPPLALLPINDVIMRLIIRDDAAATSAYVANYVVDRINAFKPNAQNPFVLGLPTGSSPLGVYKALVEKYKAGEVSLRQS